MKRETLLTSTEIERRELSRLRFGMPAAAVYDRLWRFNGAAVGHTYLYGVKTRGAYWREEQKGLIQVKPGQLGQRVKYLFGEMEYLVRDDDDAQVVAPLAVGVASLYLVPSEGGWMRKHLVMVDGDDTNVWSFLRIMRRVEQEFLLNHFVVMMSTRWDKFHGVFVYGWLEDEWLRLMAQLQEYVKGMGGVDVANIQHQKLDRFGILRVSPKRNLDGQVTPAPRLLWLNRCHYVVRRLGEESGR